MTMVVSNNLRTLITKLASNAMEARELNREIQKEFEAIGIDVDNIDFISAFGYIEGDGYIDPILDYIENYDKG